jgi:hypothetical protein
MHCADLLLTPGFCLDDTAQGDAFLYKVTLTVAMVGERTNYTVSTNGSELPFAKTQLTKPYGCFKTAKVRWRRLLCANDCD